MVFLGKSLLRDLVDEFGDRIIILAGGGINSENLKELLEDTKVKEFHASAKARVPSKMKFRNERCSMGAKSQEFELTVTNAEEVKKLVNIAQNLI